MKLYYTLNSNPRLAVAVAKYLGSPVTFERAQPMHPDHRDAFRSINPNTRAPVLESEQGSLWETDAIACRLSMLAKSDFWRQGEAQVDMIKWISWTNQHFVPATSDAYFQTVVLPTFSKVPPDEPVIAKSIAGFREWAAILDGALKGRDWLVDDRVSYGDFRTATYLPYATRARLPVDDFPNIARWHGQLMEIDAWRDPFAGLA